MKVKGLLMGAALLTMLGGCATYDDGYAYRGNGSYYGYDNNGYRRYNDGWRRWDGDRYYYRSPDSTWGFGYNQH